MTQRPATAGAAALILALALAPALPRVCEAASFGVESDTTGVAYRLRGRDGLFSIPRTFITELLTLWGTNLLGSLDTPTEPRKLDLTLSLSLDHDFGVTSSSISPSDPDNFVPLLHRTRVGILTARLSGKFGIDPSFRFDAGRLVLVDPVGFLAIDGLDLGLRFARVITLGIAAGFELMPDLRLSVFDFAPDGISWGSRDGYPPDSHPEVQEPRHRPVVMASLAIDIHNAGQLVIAYRRTWTSTSFENVSVERLGLGLDVGGWDRPISVKLRSTFDLLWLRVAEVDAEVRLKVHEAAGVGVRYEHLLPLFDSSSIFNVFDVDPHDEIGAFLEIGRPSRSILSLAAGAGLRVTDASGIEGADASHVSDISGWIAASLRLPPLALTWSARGAGGQSGTLAGTTAHATLGLAGGRLWPSAGLGLWFWEDPLRREHQGLTWGASVSLKWIVLRSITVVAGLDTYGNRVSGVGISGSARLVVDY